MVIYKYRPINKNTLASLVNRSLYFSHPIEFNDPFDSDIETNFDNAPSSVVMNIDRICGFPFPGFFYDTLFRNKDNIQYFAHELSINHSDFYSKNALICCFSEKNDNILMWSHYADSHKGIALGFSVYDNVVNDNEAYFMEMNDQRFEKMTEKHFEKPNCLPVWKVNYKDEKPEAYRIEDEPYSLLSMLRQKSTQWEYEQERRIIFPNPIGNRNVVYAESSLCEIIFGAKCEENDISLVKEITGKFFSNKLKYKKMEISKSEYSLALSDI